MKVEKYKFCTPGSWNTKNKWVIVYLTKNNIKNMSILKNKDEIINNMKCPWIGYLIKIYMCTLLIYVYVYI